jgi:hypothetical protein
MPFACNSTGAEDGGLDVSSAVWSNDRPAVEVDAAPFWVVGDFRRSISLSVRVLLRDASADVPVEGDGWLIE